MYTEPLKVISKLILEKTGLENKIQKLIKSLNFENMSFDELTESYKVLSPSLNGIELYPSHVLDDVIRSCNFTWYDTFHLERYQTQYYSDLIDIVNAWNEDYTSYKNHCLALKNWAKTSDLQEAKNKFIRIIMIESLTQQQDGFEYDW